MEADLEYIRQLYLQKLTGTLSEKEEQELEAAMKDPRIRKMCKELDELYRSPEMLELLKARPTNKRWNELAEQVMESSGESVRYMRVFRWLAAACVVALIGFSLYLFLAPDKQALTAAADEVPAAPPGTYDVRLQLAGGELLALRPDQSLQLDGVRLETDGSTLRFRQENGKDDQLHTIAVPAKKDYKVVLADGTEVWLNAASTLRFPFSFTGSTREVEIEGEAYFNVARNAEKPFIVHTPGGDIRVLGTAFNVNTYAPGKVTAALVRGSIKTSSGQAEAVLQPGQSATWARGGADMVVGRFNQANVLGWMQGVYYFDGVGLAELSTTIQRVYDLEISIDNPSLTNFRFAGKLDKNRPVGDFLEVLEITKGIKHRVEGRKIHLFQ